MIEPEIAFADLEDDMNLAEAYVKFCTQYALDNCKEDLAFFDKMIEKGLIDRLTNVVEAPFQRLTYTEAIEVLLQPKHLKKGKFQVKPYWGLDLGSEHERYLCEQVYKRPTILTDYPKEIKAFYMRLSDDEKTVQVPFGCRQHTTRVPITPLRALLQPVAHSPFELPCLGQVAAMDILVPKIGELVGGSQREERLDVLERRIREIGQVRS